MTASKGQIVPGKERDDESGKYTTSYANSDFVAAIEALEGIAGTAEVAEEVGCTRRTAYTRLKSLKSEGKVQSRQVGNSLVWTVGE